MRLRNKKIRTRQFAIARDGHILTYECERCGHRMQVPMCQGPSWEKIKHLPKTHPFKKPNLMLAQRMERWHSREAGGCTGTCPNCTRKYHEGKS